LIKAQFAGRVGSGFSMGTSWPSWTWKAFNADGSFDDSSR
jgi:hypothetical protein